MTARRIPESEVDWSRFDDHRRMQVVGAQYHQPALLTASQRLIQQHTDRCERSATLRREPDNKHDPKAIQVLVDGARVGYLKRGSAKRYNKQLAALEEGGRAESYPLIIRMKEPGFFQAHLQIPYDRELLANYSNPRKRR